MDIIKARISRLCEAAITKEMAILRTKAGVPHYGQLMDYRGKAGVAVQFTLSTKEGNVLVDVDHTNALSCYVL